MDSVSHAIQRNPPIGEKARFKGMVAGNANILAKIGAIAVETGEGSSRQRTAAAHAVIDAETIFGAKPQSGDASLDLVGRDGQAALR